MGAGGGFRRNLTDYLGSRNSCASCLLYFFPIGLQAQCNDHPFVREGTVMISNAMDFFVDLHVLFTRKDWPSSISASIFAA